MVGAFMRVNLGKLYLEPALNYSHKRSVIEEKAQALGENPDNFDLKLNTFDIPVMLGFQVLDLSIVKLRAFLGPGTFRRESKKPEKTRRYQYR